MPLPMPTLRPSLRSSFPYYYGVLSCFNCEPRKSEILLGRLERDCQTFDTRTFPTWDITHPSDITHPWTTPTRGHYLPMDITHPGTLPTRGHYPPGDITHRGHYPPGTLPTGDITHPGHYPPGTLPTRDITHPWTLPTRDITHPIFFQIFF